MRQISCSCGGRAVLVLLGVVLVASDLPAQWATQQIPLSPGWNGVQLLVQPEPGDCATVFTNTRVDKVFWWRQEGTGFEFDLDPAQPFPAAADWEYWYATNAPASSFGAMLAGECYEIFVETNAPSFVLPVKGRVVLNPTDWVPGSQNLVGLSVLPTNPVTFSQFFSFSPDFSIHSSTATVFRVGTDGTPQRVFQPATTAAVRGEAVWITAGADATRYDGPLRVSTESGRRLLDFSVATTPDTLIIENLTDAGRVVRIEHVASQSPPFGCPDLLGKPALLCMNGATDSDYASLPDVLVTNIAASSTLRLRVAPDLRRLTNGVPGAAWQGVLRITDGSNASFSQATVDSRLGVVCGGELSGLNAATGLWVGSVRVTQVNRAQARTNIEPPWDSTLPLPVAQPYEFRVILHVDSLGAVRLLQRVMVAWRPDGAVVTMPVGVYTNGTYALLSDEPAAMAYQAANPGTKIVRISSTCFPLMAPLAATGRLAPSNTVVCALQLPYNDPVNPFVHRFHPDHDNLQVRNGVATALVEGEESYTVQRTLRFEFLGADPETGVVNAQWGVTWNGGRFREQVQGLNKTIFAEGTFRVEKLSDIGALQ